MTEKAHSKWGGKRPGAGRPSGSYTTWNTEEEVIKKWNYLIQLPPRCLCGERQYRFKLENGVHLARCNHCNEQYVYDALLNEWWKDMFATT